MLDLVPTCGHFLANLLCIKVFCILENFHPTIFESIAPTLCAVFAVI